MVSFNERLSTPAAWLTALVYQLLNAWVLSIRIGVEERALRQHSSYDERLGDRDRFLPKASGHREP